MKLSSRQLRGRVRPRYRNIRVIVSHRRREKEKDTCEGKGPRTAPEDCHSFHWRAKVKKELRKNFQGSGEKISKEWFCRNF